MNNFYEGIEMGLRIDGDGSVILYEDICGRISKYYIDVKNELIRKALIIQGWTPPGGLTEDELWEINE